MATTSRKLPAVGIAVPLCGFALHAYVAGKATGGWSAFVTGLLLWSVLPYAMCLAVATMARRPLHAVVAAIFCLGLDVATYHSVFVAPSSSTAALGLLFTPLVNLLVAAPAGWFATWLATRVYDARAR